MEDECEIYFEIIHARMEIFHSTWSSYLKINLGYFISLNRDPIVLSKLEKEIEIVSDLEKRIDYMIPELQNKFESVKSVLESFNCHNHKKILHDIDILKTTSKRLISMFQHKKKENEEKLKNLKISDLYYKRNENVFEKNKFSEQNLTDVKNINKLENSNQSNYIQDYDNNPKNLKQEVFNGNNEYPNEEEKEQYLYLQNALEIEQKEFQIDKENLKQINEIRNKIKDLTMSIDKEIMKGKEALIEIDKNVNENTENIDRTNDELRKAALLKNKTNSIKYPLMMGAVFGAAGSFVPGIGNAIGATIGAGVGIAIAKIEKKAIKKVEPHKYKD